MKDEGVEARGVVGNRCVRGAVKGAQVGSGYLQASCWDGLLNRELIRAKETSGWSGVSAASSKLFSWAQADGDTAKRYTDRRAEEGSTASGSSWHIMKAGSRSTAHAHMHIEARG